MGNSNTKSPDRLGQRRATELMRRCLRLSSLARVLWLAVVALHVGLVARRLSAGEWTSTLDLARGVLCLGGVVYGSLKFWQIATILDSAPRRALAFALVLLLGHWLLAAPAQAEDPLGGSGQFAAAVLIVTPVLGVALALAAGAGSGAFRQHAIKSLQPVVYLAQTLPHAAPRRAFFLYRRPPPVSR